MPTKTKTKPAARSVAPKEKTPVTAEQPAISAEEAHRWETFQAEAERLQKTRLFRDLEKPLDIMAVLALIELSKYGTHDGTESAWNPENAPNWLGCFVFDMLLEVARNGAKQANASPEYFATKVDEVLKNLREAMEISRDFSTKLPADMLERLKKIPTVAAAGA